MAAACIDRAHDRESRREIDHAVDFQRLGRRAAGINVERPGKAETLHVLRVDLPQGAVTLLIRRSTEQGPLRVREVVWRQGIPRRCAPGQRAHGDAGREARDLEARDLKDSCTSPHRRPVKS
jgi:hypothetical protein